MKFILAAVLGASLLCGGAVASADPNDHPGYDHRDNGDRDHHRGRGHQICHWRHHHRVCVWAH
jgi:hypothetical protein